MRTTENDKLRSLNTLSREIRVAAHRKRSRLKSCTVNLLFFPRISSEVCDNFNLRASISVDGAMCGGNVASLSAPRDRINNVEWQGKTNKV